MRHATSGYLGSSGQFYFCRVIMEFRDKKKS